MPLRIIMLASAALCVALVAAEPEPSVPMNVGVPSKVDLPAENFTQEIPGSDGVKFEMVYVPGGEFLMGSPEDEPGRQPNEGPQRRVRLRPFWMAKCEVTWDEFYAFWKDEALYQTGEVPEEQARDLRPDAITRPTNTYVDELYEHGRDGYPALCMSHHAAMMYCHWLRWKTKRPYRLPTEAEWEYACRAGTAGPYCFDGSAEELTDYAWYKENSPDDDHPDGTTHPVGTKKPNKFGLHDMHGNVWEWCLDHYDPNLYEKWPANEITLGPLNMPTEKKWPHTVRGGSWADKPDRLRSAARRGSDKSWVKHDPQIPTSIWWLTKMDVIGFRVCLPVDEYPALIGLKPMVAKQPD